jgi:hypothetical protein
MTMKPGLENEQLRVVVVQAMCKMISEEVFAGSPVEFHFCDEWLETRKVVSP